MLSLLKLLTALKTKRRQEGRKADGGITFTWKNGCRAGSKTQDH
jgi:hypothetical protein